MNRVEYGMKSSHKIKNTEIRSAHFPCSFVVLLRSAIIDRLIDGAF